MTTLKESVTPSPLRAWCYLVWLSFQRQARAHLMVWISLGLLGLTLLIVLVNTHATATEEEIAAKLYTVPKTANRWTMAHWRFPRGKGPNYREFVEAVMRTGHLPWQPAEAAGQQMTAMGIWTAVHEGSGFFVFSHFIVFLVFTTFLLPIWSIGFATEGIGREREAHNLLWVLTRPIPRPAIFLAKYVALLPWCLALNLGGFALICLAGGAHGRLALQLYWPAVFWSTLAFSALFHLMGACLRRASVLALLYAFFLETVMGNMPGHFKRLSISFYTRSLMFDRAQEFGIQPEHPSIYLPVSGTTAWLVLAGVTVACLVIGAIVFWRNEYLDVS
jgi:ABC-type transport system involved in multi-copper enzyme maturation permease subunit